MSQICKQVFGYKVAQIIVFIWLIRQQQLVPNVWGLVTKSNATETAAQHLQNTAKLVKNIQDLKAYSSSRKSKIEPTSSSDLTTLTAIPENKLYVNNTDLQQLPAKQTDAAAENGTFANDLKILLFEPETHLYYDKNIFTGSNKFKEKSVTVTSTPVKTKNSSTSHPVFTVYAETALKPLTTPAVLNEAPVSLNTSQVYFKDTKKNNFSAETTRQYLKEKVNNLIKNNNLIKGRDLFVQQQLKNTNTSMFAGISKEKESKQLMRKGDTSTGNKRLEKNLKTASAAQRNSSLEVYSNRSGKNDELKSEKINTANELANSQSTAENYFIKALSFSSENAANKSLTALYSKKPFTLEKIQKQRQDANETLKLAKQKDFTTTDKGLLHRNELFAPEKEAKNSQKESLGQEQQPRLANTKQFSQQQTELSLFEKVQNMPQNVKETLKLAKKEIYTKHLAYELLSRDSEMKNQTLAKNEPIMILVGQQSKMAKQLKRLEQTELQMQEKFEIALSKLNKEIIQLQQTAEKRVEKVESKTNVEFKGNTKHDFMKLTDSGSASKTVQQPNNNQRTHLTPLNSEYLREKRVNAKQNNKSLPQHLQTTHNEFWKEKAFAKDVLGSKQNNELKFLPITDAQSMVSISKQTANVFNNESVELRTKEEHKLNSSKQQKMLTSDANGGNENNNMTTINIFMNNNTQLDDNLSKTIHFHHNVNHVVSDINASNAEATTTTATSAMTTISQFEENSRHIDNTAPIKSLPTDDNMLSTAVTQQSILEFQTSLTTRAVTSSSSSSLRQLNNLATSLENTTTTIALVSAHHFGNEKTSQTSSITQLYDTTPAAHLLLPVMYRPTNNSTVNQSSLTASSAVTTTTMSTPSWPVKHASVLEGNVILGGLMMVHSREDSITCGPIMPQGGIQALEAMLYTLDQVNKQQLLPNISLGAHILDDCDKDTYGLEMAVDFIKGE